MEGIEGDYVLDAELDMPRQAAHRVRGFIALVACIVIWMQQDHRVIKHPRRSLDLNQQEFMPRQDGLL